MSSDPPPVSGSPYIIICSGRMDVAIANSFPAELAAASRCAKELCAYIGVRHKGAANLHSDMHPVSVLQHEMMDNMNTWGKRKVETKIAEMFNLLDELEHKYPEHAY